MATYLEELLEQAAQAMPRVLANRVLAEFEPEKEQFYVRRGHVGAITRILRRSGHDRVHTFPTVKTLDDLLWASYRHLRALSDHEELIVAFGQEGKASGSLCFDGFWHGVGGRSATGFTPLARQIVDRQVSQVRGGSVVVIHNHPPHDLKSLLGLLIGWRPLPSSTDRETALAHDMAALQRWFDTGDYKGFRWYLVDEDRMSEFYLPSVERFQRTWEYLRRSSNGEAVDLLEAARILFL